MQFKKTRVWKEINHKKKRYINKTWVFKYYILPLGRRGRIEVNSNIEKNKQESWL